MTTAPTAPDVPGAGPLAPARLREPSPPPAGRPEPRNVIEALARVAEELPGIGRDQRSEQGYNYRGIEAITAHAQQLFGRYGVVFVPKILDRQVKDLTINQRPWTEDSVRVVYTVYGPGGVTDKIEVGPLIGVGRDNSDKGVNKSMTQAFKYALLQTLCIGDRADDPDAGPAHESDPHDEEVSPEEALRRRRGWLVARIRDLDETKRERVAAYCDEHSIPRKPGQMSEEQVGELETYLERIDLEDAEAAGIEAGQRLQEEAAALEPVDVDAPWRGHLAELGATEEEVEALAATLVALETDDLRAQARARMEASTVESLAQWREARAARAAAQAEKAGQEPGATAVSGPPDGAEAPTPPEGGQDGESGEDEPEGEACAICGSRRTKTAVVKGVTRCQDVGGCTRRVERAAAESEGGKA